MNKSKALRIGGFTLAVGVTASLVGFAAHGTGAYFSAATDGTATMHTGDVKLVNDTSNISFDNLLPGVDRSQTIQYQAAGSGPEDIYLALDQDQDAALTAVATPGAVPLGRYGHFKVVSNAGGFNSYNLAASDGTGSSCDTTAATGHNTVTAQHEATSASDYSNPFCPAPKYILLDSNVTGANGIRTATVTFGFTRLLGNQNSGQPTNSNMDATSSIPFRIVAEQAGVSPYDPNTTNGK